MALLSPPLLDPQLCLSLCLLLLGAVWFTSHFSGQERGPEVSSLGWCGVWKSAGLAQDGTHPSGLFYQVMLVCLCGYCGACLTPK